MSNRVSAGTLAGALGLVLLGVNIARGQAAGAPAPSPGASPAVSFATEQVASGQRTYGTLCATCHGPALQGAAGPALSGSGFQKTWMTGARTVRSLYEVIFTTMPTNHPASLEPDQVRSLIAFILSHNGLAPGTRALESTGLAALIPPGSPLAAAAPAPHRALKLPEGPQEVGQATGTLPSDAELRNVAPGDWLTFNRDYPGHRFSPLKEIDVHNVSRLAPRCILQLGEIGSFETSPVAYHGTIYLTTAHRTFAVDGASCAVRWSHTYVPTEPEHIPGNRGVALYHGKVYRGTTDGYLLALDAASGKLLWTAHVDDAFGGAFVSGAPIAFDGRIFVGEGGADNGIQGRFYAFDSETGRPLWTFHLIPAPGEPGRETWGAGQPRGASSWSSVALDVEHRLLFVPTGNPGPDFEGRERPGANLYTDSVVVLHADSGRLAWYVQQVPHDVHDWDTAAAPVIYERSGRAYLAVASKDGFLHLYDRTTHREIARAQTTTRRNTEAPFTPEKPITYCPGGLGQWNGPAYAADLGLVFVGASDRCDTIQALAKPPAFEPGAMDFGAQLMTDRSAPQTGWVRAFDAHSAKEAWAAHAPTPIIAAVTPTAGGLLLTGDLAGHFVALDARTGQQLYSFMTGGGIAGGISVYEADGHELIAVPSGNSSRGTWDSNGSATLILFGVP